MKTYSFDHFKDFFAYQMSKDALQSSNRKSDTLTKLIKKLGYNSPSLLSMIAKGQRLPSASLLEALLEKWEIPQNERESIRVQVEIEKRMKKDKEVLHLLDKLRKLRGATSYRHIDFNQFHIIRHWYIYVLKEMVSSQNFVEDPILISRNLRGKVSPADVKKGFEALISVGLIRRNSETGGLESVLADSETTNGVPSEAIQEHHRAMLERAIESITEQKVANRHLNALTLRVDPEKSQEIKTKILEFMKNMNERYQSSNSDHVYQLNVQFFEHTKSEIKKGPHEED